MKRLLLATILILIVSVAYANIRIAYYDSDRIREEWDEFRDAQARFDREMANYEVKADSMQNAMLEMRADYEKQYLMLSDDKRTEKERLIMGAQREYQAFLQQVFGEGGLAEKRNRELTQPLVEKISVVLQQLADIEGYSLILDASGVVNNIAYIDQSLEITDAVISELRKR